MHPQNVQSTMKFAYLIEPPFNHRTPAGSITGSDVELARIVVAELALGEFEPIETEFAELLPGVASDRWRMTTGLFATEERRQHALFSTPIWALPDGLLVPADNPRNLTGYKSVANQEDCTLAIIRDQIQYKSAIELGVPDSRLRVFETYAAAANAVKAGQVDAYASVYRAHTGYLELQNESPLKAGSESHRKMLRSFGFVDAEIDLIATS